MAVASLRPSIMVGLVRWVGESLLPFLVGGIRDLGMKGIDVFLGKTVSLAHEGVCVWAWPTTSGRRGSPATGNEVSSGGHHIMPANEVSCQWLVFLAARHCGFFFFFFL